MRIVERPAFEIAGKQAWIDGPDNEQFGRFWQQCRAEGLFGDFDRLKQQMGQPGGPQTGAALLGVSRVEKDPANRAFYYMIAVEVDGTHTTDGLERFQVPAATWAVFECRGQVPMSIVTAEIYAFTEWLPVSGYRHALAPEMEVYPAAADETYCEFWLPVEKV